MVRGWERLGRVEATYTPGSGVLVGTGRRWLLLGGEPATEVTERLWSLLTAPRVETSAVLDVVTTACGADVDLVLVDLTVGAETVETRGSGHHATGGGVHRLSIDTAADGAARRIVGGVVAAAAVELRSMPVGGSPVVAAPTAVLPAAPVTGLIDGIPPEILAASAPDRVPSAADVVPVTTDDPPAEPQRRMAERMGSTVRRLEHALPPSAPDPDHDGRTTFRPAEPPPPPTPPPPGAPGAPGAHLSQSTAETVLAVHCPTGHLTAAFNPRCRLCGETVLPQEPQRVTRPPLGVLHLPDGERVRLDRGVVLGRQPAPEPDGAAWPHLVRLPAGRHLRLALAPLRRARRVAGARHRPRLARRHDAPRARPSPAADPRPRAVRVGARPGARPRRQLRDRVRGDGVTGAGGAHESPVDRGFLHWAGVATADKRLNTRSTGDSCTRAHRTRTGP